MQKIQYKQIYNSQPKINNHPMNANLNKNTNANNGIVQLPFFAQLCQHPERIQSEINELLTQANAALQQVSTPDFPASWHAISSVLDVATEKLSIHWGAISHINSVMDTVNWRAAYNATLPAVTAFYADLSACEALYEKYKNIPTDTLNAEQKRAHHNALQNFILGGAELKGVDKIRFAEIQNETAELMQKFSENTLDATQNFCYIATAEEMLGVPQGVLDGLVHKNTATNADIAASEDEQQIVYKLHLKMPCYLPVMQFAHSRELRETLYKAHVTRASEKGENPKFDNTTTMQRLLALRQEESLLLGFVDFAHASVATKMAESPAQVMDFLRDLAKRSRPFAEQDVHDLRQFAQNHIAEFKNQEPQAWDWAYLSERLKESRYSFNEQEVKDHFPLSKVLNGLFELVSKLFDVQIETSDAHNGLWHPDVQFYTIHRQHTVLGHFYLDALARTGKRGGAWMDGVRERWLRPELNVPTLQTPVAHLVCNFSPGVAGQEPLLTHDDVTTLFHEFGHGLQHLLTQVNEKDVSGISGVEWDAVELPSQFMENFCWQWDVVKKMGSHHVTKEPLPKTLFEKMLAAKNFQNGMQTLRQIEFSMFDMQLHTNRMKHNVDVDVDVMAILYEVRQEVSILPSPDYSRSPHTFSHIFAGGYAAGYYSYKWAEVLSADAYAAFEEETERSKNSNNMEPNIKTAGQLFKETILESGGSRPAMESFVAFRGRKPNLDALLRHQGMVK